MKSKVLRILIVSLVVGTIAIVPQAQLLAQSEQYEKAPPPWLGEVTCKDDIREGLAGVHEFRMCFHVPEEKLYARQDTEVPLDLVIKLYAASNAKKLGLTSVNQERNDPNLIIDTSSGEPPLERGRLAMSKTYKYRLRIHDGLKSRFHRLRINGFIGEDTLNVDYDLPIGAQGDRWVDIVIDHKQSLRCWSRWSASDCGEMTLSLTNKLDYPLTIKSIDLSSDTDSLVADQSLTTSMELPDSPSPQKLKLTARSQPISWESVFSGFSSSPSLTLTIKFKDDHKREGYSSLPLKLEMKPNYVVLALFLILGAVVGTIVRINLGRMQKAGIITRKQKFVLAASTFATGVLVCLVAILGDVKLVVLSGDYSASDPKMLFLTALVTTVAGLPILYAFLKLPRPPEPEAREEDAPSPRRKRTPVDDE